MTRGLLERAGLLDESFFVYWEDTDFAMRLRALGVPVWYVPDISMLHVGGASSGGEFSPSHIRLYYRSYMQLLRKHFGWRRAVATLLRITRQQLGKPRPDHARTYRMARAMLIGLLSPLTPVPRL